MYFHNMTQIKQLARDTGSHFFDRDAIRFFGSRILSTVYGGRFFITSEQADDTSIWNGERRYTIRDAVYRGGKLYIDTIGEFGYYLTAEDAKRQARTLGHIADSLIETPESYLVP
jgi:hypothetical protein